MQEHDLIHIFISRLNKLSVPYMITGAIASIMYGAPRLTHDIDLVINLSANKIDRFAAAFPIEDFYCPPKEVIKLEIGRPHRGHFNLSHHATGYKADIYTSGHDELHQWAFNNRKMVPIEGEEFWLAPVEYVILRKLEYYREGGSEKHLQDIAGILELSSYKIDYSMLQEKIRSRMLAKEWTAAKNFKA